MDDRSFDRLARLLGGASDRRTGLKALVGGMFGAGGLAALDTDADARRRRAAHDGPDAERRRKKRKKKCRPACEGGFTCVKGQCVCGSGVTCGAACCAVGQRCEDGACADAPEPGSCIAFGEPCKDTGRRCCAGMTCASGQDGTFPIACYMTKAAPCQRTAQCAFGMTCTGGVCLGTGGGGDDGGGGGGVPTGQPCASGQNCDQPGAVCTAYTGDDAPAGDFCTLPLRKVCQGDPDCTCYKCWYVNGGAEGTARAGRRGRASTNVKACCHPPGEPCATENDCCYNLTCNAGVCGGTMCVPQGGLAADGACCSGLVIQNGVCTSPGRSPQLGEACTDGGPECEEGDCINGTCLLDVRSFCDTTVGTGAGQNNWCEAGTTCRQYVDTSQDDSYRCLRATGSTACTRDSECATRKCAKANQGDETGTCVECITDPACEKLKANVPLGTCMRWSCAAGICTQVAATNTLCTQVGGAAGYCSGGATPTCQATVTGCDVDATANPPATAGNLVTAIQNAPYKSAVSIAGDFVLTSEILLEKFGCNDNQNPDDGEFCPDGTTVGVASARVPWDVTLVVCPGKSASISGGSTVNTTSTNRAQWTWSGGSRIFHLRRYNMTVKGVTLKNAFTGNVIPSGGAFFLEAWDPPMPTFLKLRDLTITQCKAAMTGGAISASYGLVDLKNVTLTKNWAVARGGALDIDLSETLNPDQELKLDNVTMTDNVANNWETTVLASDPCSGGYCTGAGILIQTNEQASTAGTLTCATQGASAINNSPQTVTPTTQEPDGIGDCSQTILNPASTPILSWTGCGCVTTAVDA